MDPVQPFDKCAEATASTAFRFSAEQIAAISRNFLSGTWERGEALRRQAPIHLCSPNANACLFGPDKITW